MKTVTSVLCAAAVIAGLGGCAVGYSSSHGGGGVAVGFDGYYDDYYGPYYDGYWGPDGYFMYSSGPDRPFIRDEGRHFAREGRGSGFHGIRSHAHSAPAHEERR